MKRWKLSPTTWVAVALILVAVLAVSAYVACDAFDDWAPNVATEALAIAVTILVVERIVQRESRQRIKPRVDRALDVLTNAFLTFARHIWLDYLGTHLKADPAEIPSDAVVVFDFWRAGLDEVDNPRR